jgi:DNA polymerase III delta prime subunit
MKLPFIVKYRPKTFSEFKMPAQLECFLESSVLTSNLFLLLVGEPGSGKTTLLNIIIDTYFGSDRQSPGLMGSHVLFVNSLREQGIQFYRNDVKTFCQTKSAIPGKRKIVVLDDIDFINEQSQQVFRNCIDKYSGNVLFLISCINTQKVIESLQSRTTIVKLGRVGEQELTDIMDRIIEDENLRLSTEARECLRTVCNGNVRLLMNYLEKIMLLEAEITLPVMQSLCSNINHESLTEYMSLCQSGDLRAAVSLINSLGDQGYSVMDILDNLMAFVKRASAIPENDRYNLLPVICKYVVIFHEIHEDNIELTLLTNDLISAMESAVSPLLKGV